MVEVVESFTSLVGARLVGLQPGEREEVASNWVSKVVSVRELLPRLYLESALLRLPGLSGPLLAGGLERLVTRVRGGGDPLAGAKKHTKQ